MLKALVIAYFDPMTSENQTLRQTLSYFFPVYCHSRPENQSRMQAVRPPLPLPHLPPPPPDILQLWLTPPRLLSQPCTPS